MRSFDLERFWNVATHAVGIVLSLVGLYYLQERAADQTLLTQLGCWLFCGMFFVVYSVSTRYHLASTPESISLWNALDHAAIFYTIAASATAHILITPGIAHDRLIYGFQATHVVLALVWLVATLGTLRELWLRERMEWLKIILFFLQGGSIVLALDHTRLMNPPMLLVLAGCIAYIFGLIYFYLSEQKYYHAYWHVSVLVASALHYWALWLCV